MNPLDKIHAENKLASSSKLNQKIQDRVKFHAISLTTRSQLISALQDLATKATREKCMNNITEAMLHQWYEGEIRSRETQIAELKKFLDVSIGCIKMLSQLGSGDVWDYEKINDAPTFDDVDANVDKEIDNLIQSNNAIDKLIQPVISASNREEENNNNNNNPEFMTRVNDFNFSSPSLSPSQFSNSVFDVEDEDYVDFDER